MVLGPISFLIYINNIAITRKSGKITSYADNTTILFSGENWEEP